MGQSRRCIFCGREAELGDEMMFRLPPDYRKVKDEVYARYLSLRGLAAARAVLPEVCSRGSPDFSEIIIENGRPVLMTKTGRSSNTAVCPSCHNELFRDTDASTLSSAVFFGARNSGKTSLILALAQNCITAQFSPDDRYRYMFNERIYSCEAIKLAYDKAASGERPDDLREPAAIYRTASAASGSATVCDVMHDVSFSDTLTEQAIYTFLPFAASSGKFVYCIAADELYKASQCTDESEDIKLRLSLFMMMSAFRYAQRPPLLYISVTKLDKAGEEIKQVCADEDALLAFIYSVYPSIKELSLFFSGVRACPVSAFDGTQSIERLYAGLFG